MRAGVLERSARLLKRADFLATAGGRRFHTELITLQGRTRDGSGREGSGPESSGSEPAGPRVGITVTRKVGHATERNRIRRRLRAASAALLSGTPGTGAGMDVVLVARRPAISAPFGALLDDLRRGLAAVSGPGRAKRSVRVR